jgi:hypothetical protein
MRGQVVGEVLDMELDIGHLTHSMLRCRSASV